VAIAGGGLAGLALSILLAKQGHKVVLLEKEQYPFHKVCGEYISLESWDFLQGLGLDLPALQVSMITRLRVSAVNGNQLKQPLPLGGFGISRYRLDDELARIARKAGVVIRENTRVNDIVFDDNEFTLTTARQRYRAAVVCGTYGKRSNIDVKWKRPFITAPKNKLNNYIGVKYHVRAGFPADTIALHIFKNGYCGISKVEDNKYCLCYMTTAANLQQSGGQVKEMELTILSENPHLQKLFSESERLMETPVTISQISFDKKKQVENHVLMVGDAAGMITPLCGNGMSMALHSSKLAAGQVHLFLQGAISREEMEKAYTLQWVRQFTRRLAMGRMIQRLFGSRWLSHCLVMTAKSFPRFTRFLIRQTHGQPF